MPIDAYSLCPAGTGKKIKFCCADLLAELQKIERMLQGEQYLACLSYIDRLQQKHADRACLLALKGRLLRETGQLEPAVANAAAFVQKHPDNPTALAESAIVTAAKDGGRAAMGTLQRAIAGCDGGIQTSVYEAIGVVAEVLLAEGEVLPARGLLQFQMMIDSDDRRPVEMLVELNRAAYVPLLYKDERPMAKCPEDAPWKARFEEAMAPMHKGNWQAAAERLSALAEDVDDSPAIWRNLATLRGWLADAQGCIEALRKFAALDVPIEDAVEAEALAMLCSEDPLGDPLEVLKLIWTIREIEQFQAGLALERRAVQIAFDRSSFTDGDTPGPKAVYWLLDRPIPETAENITLDAVPGLLGQATLYGRQTDREARLEVLGVTAADLQQTMDLLGDLAGNALAADVKQEVVERVSASYQLLERKWRPPDDITPQQIKTLTAEHQRRALLQEWPQLKLGILDGKSPRQLADQESWRVKLLAAVMVLEFWNQQSPVPFDFNQLRSELGLPTLEPIDPQQTPPGDLPLVRLGRVTVEKLSDEDLLMCYRRAVAFGANKALPSFAAALTDRPTLAGREEQLRAYHLLARIEEDPDRALGYLEDGREAARSAGQSCASWDLLELSFRFTRGQGSELQRLVKHIQSQHIEEPGVADALARFLVQIGVLRPDGTPAAAPSPQDPTAAADQQASAELGKIWTPDGEESGGERKIWTPD